MALGSTQPRRSTRKAGNLTVIWKPIVYKTWETRRLTNLWASTACYRDTFIFCTFHLFYLKKTFSRLDSVSVVGERLFRWAPSKELVSISGEVTSSIGWAQLNRLLPEEGHIRHAAWQNRCVIQIWRCTGWFWITVGDSMDYKWKPRQ
jgi:hypothetical protein